MTTIKTARLELRLWRDEDLEPFAALCADPRVMAYFPKLLTRPEAEAALERARAAILARGFGFWAVEAPGVAPFLGYVGLSVPAWEAHFTPCVEIGWRLAHEFWAKAMPGRRLKRRCGLDSTSSACPKSCRLPCRPTSAPGA